MGGAYNKGETYMKGPNDIVLFTSTREEGKRRFVCVFTCHNVAASCIAHEDDTDEQTTNLLLNMMRWAIGREPDVICASAVSINDTQAARILAFNDQEVYDVDVGTMVSPREAEKSRNLCAIVGYGTPEYQVIKELCGQHAAVADVIGTIVGAM